MKRRLEIIILLIISTFFFLSMENEDMIINATIEPNTIYVNEEFKIIVTIESNKPINIQQTPEFDKIYDIKIVKEAEIEESYKASYLNGKIFVRYITKITFFLICEEEVNIAGTSLKFKINDKYHILKDFFIPVVSKSSFDLSDFQNILIFNYEPKQIYIGQPFVCEWDIFTKEEIERLDIINLPLIKGAVFQKIETENSKEVISIFDQQINKYVLLKLLIFPDSNQVIFDKFDFRILYIINDEKREYIQTFPDKEVKINSFPYEYPNFFGLIGNYSLSYDFKIIENKSSIYYNLQIIISGNGNHKYVNFKKLNIDQQYFNTFGPDIYLDDNSAVLNYYFYPKQSGFISLNQINIPVFNPKINDYEVFIIPKSTFYVSQNFEQIFSNFNFSKKIQQFSNFKFENFYDYFQFFNIYILFLIFILFAIIFLTLKELTNKKIEKDKELFFENQNIIGLWNIFSNINGIKSEDDYNNWLFQQNNKTKNLFIEINSIYKSYFQNTAIEYSKEKLNRITKKFYKYLKKNLKKDKIYKIYDNI